MEWQNMGLIYVFSWLVGSLFVLLVGWLVTQSSIQPVI